MHADSVLKAYLAGIAFSLLVGFSFFWTKICVGYADAFTIMAYRFDFALLALLVMLVLKKEGPGFHRRSKKAVLTAGFSYSLFLLLQAAGIVYTSSIEAAVIFATAPVFVEIIAAVFLKEKHGIKQSIFVLLVIVALIIMIAAGSSEISFDIRATIILLISTVFMAVYTVAVRGASSQYTSLEVGGISVVTGFLIFNLIFAWRCIATDESAALLKLALEPVFMTAAAYLGIFCILFSTILTGYMGKHLQSTVMSVFGNVSSGISILAGALLLGEKVYLHYIICMVLIIIGVVGTAVTSEEKGSLRR